MGRKTTPRTCENCGLVFSARLDKLRAGNGRFCSRSCAKSGAFHHNWQGGLKHNRTVYERIQRQKYPQRYKARKALQQKVRSGKIKRLPCEVCGATPSEAHHEDYNQPLVVRWLCRDHHVEVHSS